MYSFISGLGVDQATMSYGIYAYAYAYLCTYDSADES